MMRIPSAARSARRIYLSLPWDGGPHRSITAILIIAALLSPGPAMAFSSASYSRRVASDAATNLRVSASVFLSLVARTPQTGGQRRHVRTENLP